ncbi:MAG: hypothetical protein ACKN9T_07150 [Candidatus Methylumidiphilus sp.]
MNNPFDLSDTIIRDLPHVRVTRHAPQAGRACEYRKIFKPEGLGGADYWMRRENDFLLDFTLKRLRHTVELAAFAQGGAGGQTPVVESVATRDAGLTVEDWLRVQPKHANGAVWQHPFQHAGVFLQLLRACLLALREIHAHGIVHCDIKEDNICLPYAPYPFQDGQAIGIGFERIRLIDFAFSVTPERPLDRPLPILPAAPYQSNLLKTALSGDRQGRGGLSAQQLDCRADLFSLGYLAGRIADIGLLQPMGAGGAAAMDGARRLAERLQAFDNARSRISKTLPHDALIADIDQLLAGLPDLDHYRQFTVADVRDSAALGWVGRSGGPTPLTPLATPADLPTPLPPLPPRAAGHTRRAGWGRWMLVLAAAALAAWAYYAGQDTPPPAAPAMAPPPAEVKPPVVTPKPKPKPAETAAEQRAKREAKWRQDAEAQYQAEEAARKRAEAEAAAPPTDDTPPEADKPALPVDDTLPAASEPSAAIAYPTSGERVGRAITVTGTLQGLRPDQHAFLVIRSTAAEYGRLYYPQAELPQAGEWQAKGIYATPNYAYETFVVVAGNPQTAEILRDGESRRNGLESLPEGAWLISRIVTVKR